MEIDTLEHIKIVIVMVKELSLGLMEENTKENGKMEVIMA